MKNTTLSELLHFCQEKSCVGALLLTGDWGCGKTHLIEKSLKEQLVKTNSGILIRVSLFGLSSVSEIHSAVRKAYMDSFLENKGLGQAAGIVSGCKNKLSGLGSALDELIPKRFTQLASIDVSSFIDVEEMIDGRRTILVFDDLERCRADIVDVLGVINDYCENKGIRTIIVANQEKIGKQPDHQNKENENGTGTGGSLSYSEIKEKIVQRTVYFEPSDEDIIECVESVLEDMKADDYRDFVLGCRHNLISLMAGESASRNLRSLKCAVSDYNRVYGILKTAGVGNQRPWFLNFVSYLMAAKDGVIEDEGEGIIFMDSKVRGMYPGYQNGYVLDGVKYWIMHGEWDEDLIMEEAGMRMDREKGLSPAELIRLNLLQDLDESVIESGWKEFLSNAYKGNMNLDDYTQLVSNSYWSRKSGYRLPEEIDWGKVESGLKERIHILEDETRNPENGENARERDFIARIRLDIGAEQKASFTDDEERIYRIVHDFTEKGVLQHYKNRADYVSLIVTDPMAAFAICRNKRFDRFSTEMAEATVQGFKVLANADKHAFVSEFRNLINEIDMSEEDNLRESITGYKCFRGKMENLKAEYQQNGKSIAKWHTERMLDAADDAIHKLEEGQDTVKDTRTVSYSEDELDSIRYYQGDTSNYSTDYRQIVKKELYAIGNAYEVLNTLLYPGISNEEARIIKEKRKLSPMLLDNMEDVLMTYGHMVSAIFKNEVSGDAIRTYRFDRKNSIQFLELGESCSFMSTTQAADLDYFKKKCGLALEEIIAEPGTPCLDMNKMLTDKGKYSHEKEILFPPFVKLEMKEADLSEIESTYRDKENKPPVGKWEIHITGCEEADGGSGTDCDLSQDEWEMLRLQILDKTETSNAKKIWECMENNHKVEEGSKKKYIAWKVKIQKYVRLLCMHEQCKARAEGASAGRKNQMQGCGHE